MVVVATIAEENSAERGCIVVPACGVGATRSFPCSVLVRVRKEVRLPLDLKVANGEKLDVATDGIRDVVARLVELDDPS